MDWSTPRGPIQVDWKNENGKFELSVTLPAGMSARIELPASNQSTGVECQDRSAKATRVSDRWMLDESVQGIVTF